MITVSIIEDHDDIRKTLALIVNKADGFSCISTYGDCESALKTIEEDQPDVILMDIGLPGMSGIEGVKRIRKIVPDTEIIMVTVYQDDKRVFEALCAGACGYLTKNVSPARLLAAIQDAHDGGSPMSANIARMVVKSFRIESESPLSNRETEVLRELCDGKSYKMIADDLSISETTVHSHIKSIYRKLEVHSQTEAVAKAFREKLI